jgi:hypothetical protein
MGLARHPSNYWARSSSGSPVFLRMGYRIVVSIALYDLPEGLPSPHAGFATSTVGPFLATAIGLHNIPQGLAIAAPLRYGGMGTGRAISLCVLISFVTPLGTLLGMTAIRSRRPGSLHCSTPRPGNWAPQAYTCAGPPASASSRDSPCWRIDKVRVSVWPRAIRAGHAYRVTVTLPTSRAPSPWHLRMGETQHPFRTAIHSLVSATGSTLPESPGRILSQCHPLCRSNLSS